MADLQKPDLQKQVAELEAELADIQVRERIETLKAQLAEAKRERKAPTVKGLPKSITVSEGKPEHFSFEVEDLEEYGTARYSGPEFCAVLWLDGWTLEVAPGPGSAGEYKLVVFAHNSGLVHEHEISLKVK